MTFLLLLNLLLTKKKQSPENVASLLVRLTFLWMDRLIKTGFRRNIKPDDIWEIDKSESSENISKKRLLHECSTNQRRATGIFGGIFSRLAKLS